MTGWRTTALRLALSGEVDAARQQRILRDLLDRGQACAPPQVVEALRHAAERDAGGATLDARGADRAYAGDPSAALRRGRTRLEALDGRFLLQGDEGYPAPLRDAWPELGAPLWLFAAGRPASLAGVTAVAVVGTRSPTIDGLRTARLISAALARAGAVVVSGMARGIDQAAHRAALDAGGTTIAVLGTGLGVDYPSGATALRTAIARGGTLLTELPPGAGPRPWQFLARNRIISGLAAATVVVEGGPTSGALQTARLAAGQGRDVWAVPGSINARTSQAPLALLRDGALPVTSVDVLLDGLGLGAGGGGLPPAPPAPELSATAATVLALLSSVPATVDALVAASTLPARTAMAAIAELTEAGVAVATPRGVVRA